MCCRHPPGSWCGERQRGHYQECSGDTHAADLASHAGGRLATVTVTAAPRHVMRDRMLGSVIHDGAERRSRECRAQEQDDDRQETGDGATAKHDRSMRGSHRRRQLSLVRGSFAGLRLLCRRWGERFDDPVLGDRAPPTLADKPVELTAQCRQVGDLALDLRKVLAGERVHRLARAATVVGQAEKLAHVLNREAEIAGAADETQPGQVIAVVRSIITRGAHRGGGKRPIRS